MTYIVNTVTHNVPFEVLQCMQQLNVLFRVGVCVCVCAHAHMCICILQCVHIGLQNYGEYEVAVAAKTAVGTGPYSIAQNFTAPEGGESPTLITILLCAAFGSVQHRQALKKRTGMKASHTYICRFRVSV